MCDFGGIKMANMMEKVVFFLTVDGFDSKAFSALWQCFGNLNAWVQTASFNAADEIKSMDGSVNTHSDRSFNEVYALPFDVIVISDGITANAIKDDPDVKAVLKKAADESAAIVVIDDGVSALIPSGLLNGATVAAPDYMKEALESAGAKLSDQPIVESDNIFSARADADMQELCSMVADYITTKRQEVA